MNFLQSHLAGRIKAGKQVKITEEANTIIFKAVGENTVVPSSINFANGMFDGDTDSLIFPGTGADSCLDLFQLSEDNPYIGDCLATPEKCEYGFSISIWVKFLQDSMKEEMLVATGPSESQGFQFYIKDGNLNVKIVGKVYTWSAKKTITKHVNSWMILGFTWRRFNNEINILIGSTMKKFSNAATTNMILNYPASTNFFIGCIKDTGNQVRSDITPNIAVSHVAFWAWPVQYRELLSGSKVYSMIKEVTSTTAIPTTTAPNLNDFSRRIQEIVATTADLNPIYKTADIYVTPETVSNGGSLAGNFYDRKGFKLSGKNSKIKLDYTFKPSDLTVSGFSMSFWIYMKDINGTSGDIIDIMSTFHVKLKDKKLYFYVHRENSTRLTLYTSDILQGIWQNIGFTVNKDLTNCKIFINGILDNTAIKTYEPEITGRPVDTDVNPFDFLIGSGYSDALVDTVISDLVVHKRYLLDFEVHKFIGYTASQFKQLFSSTNYWTTDTYINRDSKSLRDRYVSNEVSTKSRSSLSSILKLRSTSFDMDMDLYKKSKAQSPILKPQWDNHMFLGRTKYWTQYFKNEDINWKGQCLTDPCIQHCRVSGFTISFWLKIKSASMSKIQFYLNTGDLADYVSSSDGRGVSIFTNQKLLGISVSTCTSDWNIIIDSNKYQIDKWMNIGLLWREEYGLRLLIDGIDHSLLNKIPDKRTKSYDIGTRAVLNRFDFDDEASWSRQSIWEMGFYVFGEMSYLERYLTPEEYSEIVILNDISLISTATWFRLSTQLIDIPIDELIKEKEGSFNFKGNLDWDSSSKSVKILSSGAQIPVFVDPNQCPIKLSECSNGLSIGGWFYISHNFPSGDYKLIHQGNKDAGDSFGLIIGANKHLMGWLRIGNDYWHLNSTYRIFSETRNGWNFLGIRWKKENGFFIIVNGQDLSGATKTTITNTGSIIDKRVFVGDINVSIDADQIFMIHGVIFYDKLLNSVQISKLMGIPIDQQSLLSKSTFYWTISGLYSRLTKSKITSQNVAYEKNKSGKTNGAMCTSGSTTSFVKFQTNRFNTTISSCLNDPDLCTSFILIINVKLTNFTGDKGYLLISGGDIDGTRGVAIYQNSKNELKFVLRSKIRLCNHTVTLDKYDEWIQLKLIWQIAKNPIIKINEQDKGQSRYADCKVMNNPTVNTELSSVIMGRKANENTGALRLCVSDVMLIHMKSDEDPNNATSGLFSNSCYENNDYLDKLNGDQTDNFMADNEAILLKDASVKIDSQSCLFNPTTCTNGLSVSIWLKLNEVPSTEQPILVTGKRGLGILVQPGTSNAKASIHIYVHTGSKKWSITREDLLPPNEWSNIGLVWSEDLSTGLSLFVNGLFVHTSTIYNQETVTDISPNNPLLMSTSLNAVINNFAIWYSVIATCQSPRSSHKHITGLCKEDLSLSAQKKCSQLENCEKANGPICVDETKENVIRLSKTLGKITSVKDGINILKVVDSVLKKTIVSNTTLVKSSLDILTNAADNLIIPEEIDDSFVSNVTKSFGSVNNEIYGARYKDNWMKMSAEKQYEPLTVIDKMETFYLRVAKQMATKCSTFSHVENNMAISLMSYDNTDTKCMDVAMPNYADPKWKDKHNSNDSFLLNTDKLKMQGAKIAISSTIYNSTGVFPSETNGTISDSADVKLDVNSKVISVKTDPKINRVPGETLINITQKFVQPNKRKARLQKWQSNHEEKNLKLKYEWFPVFWKIESNNQPDVWDKTGCNKIEWNSTHVLYSSDHMTSFAILMQPVNEVITNDDMILKYITYGGLSISVICLLIFVITIAASPYLTGTRYIIHLNLGIALLLASIVFMLTDVATYQKIFCQAVGLLVHFFFLATFTWMFVEAIFVFYAVTNGKVEGRLKCYIPFAWGIPFVIVLITAILSLESYGRNDFCWLSSDNNYIWAFLGPLLLFLIMTIIVCLIVACNIMTPVVKGDALDDVKDNIKQTAVAIPLMLTGWVVGSVYIYTFSVPLAYVFTIMGTLQGLWVFLFFGIGNPDFRLALCRKQRIRERRSSVIGILSSINSSSNSTASLRTNRPGGGPPKMMMGSAPVYYAGPPPKARPQTPSYTDDSSQNELYQSEHTENGEYDANVEATVVRNDGVRSNTPRNIPGTPHYED